MSQPPYQPDDWGSVPAGYYPSAPTQSYPPQSYPPPYDAPPGSPYGYPGQYPYVPPPRRGNGMAVAGFVLSFFIGLLGLIFSIIGLRRSGEPGRSGRGLAIAGIVISILNMALSGLVFAGVLSTTADMGSAPAESKASTAPAPVPGSETVPEACHVIIPAVTGAQADLQTASSAEDMLNKINKLADTVQRHGVASGDAGFTKDTATLAKAYRDLANAAQHGQKPDTGALARAGEAVGYDCGRVGVTG